jgi:hypothetical protein
MVAADQGDMKRLIAMYFGPKAPFAESEEKKNEFPDAIALMTLEDWAKKNNKKVLAISGDKGWAQFADDSEWIDVEMDLAAALQELQKDADHARKIVANLLHRMDAGEAPELLQELEANVERQVCDLSPVPDATADYYCDAELTSMSFGEMQFFTRGRQRIRFLT